MDMLSALAAVVDAHAPTDRSVTYIPLPDVLTPSPRFCTGVSRARLAGKRGDLVYSPFSRVSRKIYRNDPPERLAP
jgi:hypothetical protein